MDGFIKNSRYLNALCLVYPDEADDLQQALSDFVKIKCVQTLDDFKKEITDDKFLLFSYNMTNEIERLISIMRSFPNISFHSLLTCTGAGIAKQRDWNSSNIAMLKLEPNFSHELNLRLDVIKRIKNEVQNTRHNTMRKKWIF
jgi:hypothetical protein